MAIVGTNIAEAARILKEGGIVAFETDTVYGLACRCDSERSVKRLREAKSRPENKPLPLIVSSFLQASTLVSFDLYSEELFKKLLPGAITLVLKKQEEVADWVSLGFDTLAIRMIDMPFINQMIDEVGVPLCLTSANSSGEPVCQNGQQINERLGDKVDYIIDGIHRDGLASTIIDCTKNELTILREGAITKEKIMKILEGNR